MNGEKPKFRPWPDVVKESKATIKVMEQQLVIQKAVLKEAIEHLDEK